MKRKGIIITVIVSILAVAGIVWLFISGHLTWAGFGNTAAAKSICSTSIVDEYNKATNYEQREGPGSVPTIDTDAMKSVADKVKALPGNGSDPTCQVILFWTAVQADDIATAKNILPELKRLNSEGIFPNNNLRTTVPLFEYEAALSQQPADSNGTN